MTVARVLVVDDQEENLQLMTYLLGAFGHDTFVAHDGLEALDLAARGRPDVIVMDVHMPRMDGLEAATLMKADGQLRLIPLVAVTASAMVGDRERVMAAGFDGWISKPIEPETFVMEVEAFLGSAVKGTDGYDRGA